MKKLVLAVESYHGDGRVTRGSSYLMNGRSQQLVQSPISAIGGRLEPCAKYGVGVGVFPEREKILICIAAFGLIALRAKSEADVRKGIHRHHSAPGGADPQSSGTPVPLLVSVHESR